MSRSILASAGLIPDLRPYQGNPVPTITTNSTKISKHLDSTPTPPSPKNSFSFLVLATLLLMAVAVILAVLSAVLILPALPILATVVAVCSTTCGILSLRE